MAEGKRRRRRAAVLGIPALGVAIIALVALLRVGAPTAGEPGAAATIGLNPDRHTTLEHVLVRQLTSERTFWAGAPGDDPIFIVSGRPLAIEPGSEVTIAGKVEAAPEVEVARRTWGVNEATARAVRERGIYVLASRITSTP